MYDLGAGAVEFIICHAQVSITFVEEKKISEVCLYPKLFMIPVEKLLQWFFNYITKFL